MRLVLVIASWLPLTRLAGSQFNSSRTGYAWEKAGRS